MRKSQISEIRRCAKNRHLQFFNVVVTKDDSKTRFLFWGQLVEMPPEIIIFWTSKIESVSIFEVQKMIILGGISTSWPQNKNLLFESSFVTTALKNCKCRFFVRRRIFEICDIPIGKPLFYDTFHRVIKTPSEINPPLNKQICSFLV